MEVALLGCPLAANLRSSWRSPRGGCPRPVYGRSAGLSCARSGSLGRPSRQHEVNKWMRSCALGCVGCCGLLNLGVSTCVFAVSTHDHMMCNIRRRAPAWPGIMPGLRGNLALASFPRLVHAAMLASCGRKTWWLLADAPLAGCWHANACVLLR